MATTPYEALVESASRLTDTESFADIDEGDISAVTDLLERNLEQQPIAVAGAIALEQEIRFCTASDGVQIAYATVGQGPPLVKAPNWINHLEYDWQSPVWRHLLRDLAAENTLIRFDQRANGLSDWDVTGPRGLQRRSRTDHAHGRRLPAPG